MASRRSLIRVIRRRVPAKAPGLTVALLADLAVRPLRLAVWVAVARAVLVALPVVAPVPVDQRPARLAASLVRLVALVVRRQLRLADPVAAH